MKERERESSCNDIKRLKHEKTYRLMGLPVSLPVYYHVYINILNNLV